MKGRIGTPTELVKDKSLKDLNRSRRKKSFHVSRAKEASMRNDKERLTERNTAPILIKK